MVRHFGIFPVGFDKNNLFDEQKIFLMYLVGIIPDMPVWERNVSYQSKLDEIKSIKDIKMDQYDIDLARLQKRDITELKKIRLIEHKKNEIKKLNESFGIKEEEDQIERHIEFKKDEDHDPNKLWKMLQGKGIVNNA